MVKQVKSRGEVTISSGKNAGKKGTDDDWKNEIEQMREMWKQFKRDKVCVTPCPKCGGALESMGKLTGRQWKCDATKCKAGITEFGKHNGVSLFRCAKCDMDICNNCADSHTAPPSMLKDIHIADDGGVNTDEVLKLYNTGKVVQAVMMLFFIVSNVYALLVADLPLLFGYKTDPPTPEGFLVTRPFFNMLTSGMFTTEQVIAFSELAGLVVLILWTVICSYRAVKAAEEEHESLRWHLTTVVFFVYMQWLANYSAMGLLYYATPAVLSTHLTQEIAFAQEKYEHKVGAWGSAKDLLKYLGFVIVCALVGFDSFLVKTRSASQGVLVLQEDLTFNAALICIMFLVQMLGIVNVYFFVQGRLFTFIFGGEDSVMTNKERANQYLWSAQLAKKVFETHGFLKFCVVMFAYSDFDFQMLVLNEAGSKAKENAAGYQPPKSA